MLGRLVTIAAVTYGGVMLAKKIRNTPVRAGALSNVEVSIDVDVPVRTAYDQWTQFEEFPRFMKSVQEIRQLDDTHLHWKATVAGKPKEWDAEITEQLPDQRIAWHNTTGPMNAGVVTFEKLSEARTRIKLNMTYAPETMDEKIVDTVGAVKFEAHRNLRSFKQLIEAAGTETGAWRGEVHNGTPQH
ncbi:MAG TPA: SRPBCC family protein [Ramlibacter sp.]|jgi:uncharacterized membrane protein|nr:SRPBCC family protein [Ramlibacter sp.]